MKQLSHIVWNEGMHLAQHHFQAQSRFFEDTIQFALTSLFYKPYGVAACELNAEALQNDTVALVHARGLMPDGLPFDIPGSDAPVAPLLIRDRFSPTSDSHLMYDTDYIAPSLHIGASARLVALLHRVVEMLDAKADTIGRGRRGSSDEFAQREVASFWLLHAIHASVPTLRHYAQAKQVHPE